jgi:hypothetical protein
MKATTYALDDIIGVVMRGNGFTALEKTTMDSGEPERVIAVREDFQRFTAQRWQADNLGAHPPQDPRFLSQAHGDPDITMEIFFTDGPIEGPSGFRSVRDRANRVLHVQRRRP